MKKLKLDIQKVIGKTKRKKEVKTVEQSRGFTGKDHEDAMNIHENQKDKYYDKIIALEKKIQKLND